ncbi:MAG: hypothetical protein U0271_01790 [Polyangiaceae bacterium]
MRRLHIATFALLGCSAPVSSDGDAVGGAQDRSAFSALKPSSGGSANGGSANGGSSDGGSQGGGSANGGSGIGGAANGGSADGGEGNGGEGITGLELGASCTSATQCASYRCVDGVCCDDFCNGACEACAAAITGAPDGHCVSLSGGDPQDECPLDDCGGTGVCSVGACETQAGGCGSYCGGSLPCYSPAYCDVTRTCVHQQPLGGPCLNDRECMSGACGGVCVAASCRNGVQDNDEIAVDCGPSCLKSCMEGQPCSSVADCRLSATKACENGVCTGCPTRPDFVNDMAPCGGGLCRYGYYHNDDFKDDFHLEHCTGECLFFDDAVTACANGCIDCDCLCPTAYACSNSGPAVHCQTGNWP